MYSELLSSSKPGLIMIMLDESTSMSDKYASSNKAEFAALAVNRVIAEIIAACTVGDEVRDRCYIAVIGYGKNVNLKFSKKVSNLAKESNTKTLKKNVSDGAGGLVEIDEIIRVFVNPTASGGTPMAQAFEKAYEGVKTFIDNQSDSFPPIVINITDGEPDDFTKTANEAKKLAQLKTRDGNVIVMNAHISTATDVKVELPSSNNAFTGNKFANFLFDISTVLPENLANRAKEIGFNIQSGSRGFVFNADAQTLIRILNFGSLGALR